MASTYTYADVLDFVGQGSPRLQQNSFGAMMMDQVNSYVWNWQDWRISLVKLLPFFLVPGQQDYGAPNAPIPSDFLGLRKAELIYTLTQPPFHYPPLHIDRVLYSTAWQGRAEAFSYEPSIGKWRVYPRVPLGIGPTDWQIEVVYKKLPTKVTTANMAQLTLPWDDIYFSVFETGLRWKLAETSGASADDIQKRFVLFRAELDRMAANEAVNLGDEGLSPSEPFADW